MAFEYITWFPDYRFKQFVQLGKEKKYYQFFGDYHIRNDSWYITLINDDDTPILYYQRLILDHDTLEFCTSKLKPECYLVPLTDDDNIKTITYDGMVSKKIKLFCIDKS